MEKLAHVNAAGILKIYLRLSENCRNWCEADFQPLIKWAFGKLWVNLYPTFALPSSVLPYDESINDPKWHHA